MLKKSKHASQNKTKVTRVKRGKVCVTAVGVMDAPVYEFSECLLEFWRLVHSPWTELEFRTRALQWNINNIVVNAGSSRTEVNQSTRLHDAFVGDVRRRHDYIHRDAEKWNQFSFVCTFFNARHKVVNFFTYKYKYSVYLTLGVR